MLVIKKIKKLPDAPGVYFFTRGREILYIGKATSLRDRVRSYFSSAGVETSRGGRIVQMLALATGIRYQKTDSVLEALLLESALIKKHQPKYNAREKDDKSFWYVIITDEEFPRVLMVRGQNLKAKEVPTLRSGPRLYVGATFGPFPNTSELREALRLIRKIFPYRDKCQPLVGKKCFNAQIGLCPGVCSGEITTTNYRRRINHLKLLLAGRVRPLIAKLTREMRATAKRQDFEKSAPLRDQICALQHIQDVGLIKNPILMSRLSLDMNSLDMKGADYHRIEAYDIAHLGGSHAVGVMVVAEDGELKKSDYRKFKVNHGGDDLANLREVLERRLVHTEWPRPDLIVVDGGVNQFDLAQKVLTENKITIPIVAGVKDKKHKPKEILSNQKLSPDQHRLIFLINHEAHRFAITFHRHRRKIV
ncbi:MAG: GIY-YIG nuclease family protein [Candidatus Vogelbacteria bacterium]